MQLVKLGKAILLYCVQNSRESLKCVANHEPTDCDLSSWRWNNIYASSFGFHIFNKLLYLACIPASPKVVRRFSKPRTSRRQTICASDGEDM